MMVSSSPFQVRDDAYLDKRLDKRLDTRLSKVDLNGKDFGDFPRFRPDLDMMD